MNIGVYELIEVGWYDVQLCKVSRSLSYYTF